jgi:hypothetical protein
MYTPQLGTGCSQHAAAAWVEWQPPLVLTMLQRLLGHGAMIKQHHVASLYRDLAQLGFLCLSPEAAAAALEAGTAAAMQFLPDPAAIGFAGVRDEAVPAGAGRIGSCHEQPEAAEGLLPDCIMAADAARRRADTEASDAAANVMRHCLLPGQITAGPTLDISKASAAAAGAPAAAEACPTDDVAVQHDVSIALHAGSSSAAVARLTSQDSLGCPDNNGSSSSSSCVKPNAKVAVTSKAAARAAASAALLARVQPQLQRVGLLGLYQQLSSMYPRGTIANFKPVVGTAVQTDVNCSYTVPVPAEQLQQIAAVSIEQQQQQQQQLPWPAACMQPQGAPPPPTKFAEVRRNSSGAVVSSTGGCSTCDIRSYSSSGGSTGSRAYSAPEGALHSRPHMHSHTDGGFSVTASGAQQSSSCCSDQRVTMGAAATNGQQSIPKMHVQPAEPTSHMRVQCEAYIDVLRMCVVLLCCDSACPFCLHCRSQQLTPPQQQQQRHNAAGQACVASVAGDRPWNAAAATAGAAAAAAAA